MHSTASGNALSTTLLTGRPDWLRAAPRVITVIYRPVRPAGIGRPPARDPPRGRPHRPPACCRSEMARVEDLTHRARQDSTDGCRPDGVVCGMRGARPGWRADR